VTISYEISYTNESGVTRPLLRAFTGGDVTLPPSVLQINLNNLSSTIGILQTETFDIESSRLLERSTCLLPGSYEVCVQIVGTEGAITDMLNDEVLSQTCYTKHIELLSNLYLVSPFEGDEISMQLPLFTWTPVAPFDKNGSYRLEIVEILGFQSSFEAMRSNPLAYQEVGLLSNLFQYPVNARPFNECSNYAWRISYEINSGFSDTNFRRGRGSLSESEIWTFTTPCEVEEEAEDDEVNIVNENVPTFYFPTSLVASEAYNDQQGNLLRVEIDNPYQSLDELRFELIDVGGRKTSHICCASPTEDEIPQQAGIQNGKNYLTIDLSEYKLESGRYYRIIFTDFKVKQYLNIQYIDDEE